MRTYVLTNEQNGVVGTLDTRQQGCHRSGALFIDILEGMSGPQLTLRWS